MPSDTRLRLENVQGNGPAITHNLLFLNHKSVFPCTLLVCPPTSPPPPPHFQLNGTIHQVRSEVKTNQKGDCQNERTVRRALGNHAVLHCQPITRWRMAKCYESEKEGGKQEGRRDILRDTASGFVQSVRGDFMYAAVS